MPASASSARALYATLSSPAMIMHREAAEEAGAAPASCPLSDNEVNLIHDEQCSQLFFSSTNQFEDAEGDSVPDQTFKAKMQMEAACAEEPTAAVAGAGGGGWSIGGKLRERQAFGDHRVRLCGRAVQVRCG